MAEFCNPDVLSNRARVLLADDHQLVLDRLRTMLQGRFDIVGMVCDGQEMVAQALRLAPDVIVADISMPLISGIEALQRLHELGSESRFVFLTIYSEAEFVDACLAAGAMGYVTKSHMKTDLVPAIEAALTGRKHVSPMGPVRH